MSYLATKIFCSFISPASLKEHTDGRFDALIALNVSVAESTRGNKI